MIQKIPLSQLILKSKTNKVVLLIAFSSFLLIIFSSLAHGYTLYFGNDKALSPSVQNSSSIASIASTSEKDSVFLAWVNKNNHIYFTFSGDAGNKFTPIILLSGSDKSSTSPKIVTTEKGDVYVVWVDKNNASENSNVEFVSSNDSGKTFSGIKELASGKSISSFPQIAATEKGDVYVVWVDKNNKTKDTDIVFRSSNDSGIDFDDRKKLRRSDTLLSDSPQLVANEKGDVYVVWTDKNRTTAYSDIAFRTSSNNGKDFQRVINLNKGDKISNSTLPQIAITGNDSVYAVWLDKQIQLKQILVKDAIVGETISLSNKTTTSLFPQITGTKNGNLFALWIDKDNASDTSLHLKKISENSFERDS